MTKLLTDRKHEAIQQTKQKRDVSDLPLHDCSKNKWAKFQKKVQLISDLCRGGWIVGG